MKKLMTPTGSYGPFNTVVVADDYYLVDGAHLPFTIYGAGGEIADWAGPLPTPPIDPSVARAAAKAAREEAVANIKVTTQAGNTFDGDETSQTRMARAIVALQATRTPSVTWVLADNTVINATVAELAEALALAGAAQAAIWVIE